MLRLTFFVIGLLAAGVAHSQPGYFTERVDGQTLDGWIPNSNFALTKLNSIR